MTRSGLDIVAAKFPKELAGKKIGLLCHAASITSKYRHAVDVFLKSPCKLAALFGPQHGMFGQTQDNMVEWQGYTHPVLKIPVYSLYGETRKPGRESLSALDAFVVDLQDVGARPYTYVWTVKLCMEACSQAGIPLWILDRPNPIAALPFDGPMLSDKFHSFVGGAPIPLCHRMTMGEMALLLKNFYFPTVNLQVVWMKGWQRNSLWPETGLPWVLPSPNIPTFDTAVVYPGTVLLEATNLSEGRGTTRPFEIIGAPYLDADKLVKEIAPYDLKGCVFRKHDFMPTFQKWQGKYCYGLQVHVTDPRKYEPVLTTAALLQAVIKHSDGQFSFKQPPYEYDTVNMPFDILSGDTTLRNAFMRGADLRKEKESWKQSYKAFLPVFKNVSHYPEKAS
ncbi:MAG TPA: DUF1343 domain-containing protein [Chitinivibrionales bacterium]|nr:DUF1343 domain-containing protein [Chitinivibrionales bacterium]